jgi:hypothetical protein
MAERPKPIGFLISMRIEFSGTTHDFSSETTTEARLTLPSRYFLPKQPASLPYGPNGRLPARFSSTVAVSYPSFREASVPSRPSLS